MPTASQTTKVDDQSTSGSSQADDATDSVTVNTDGAAYLYIFVDDDAGTPADHSGYELTIEVKGNVDGTERFQEYESIGGDGTSAETARSWRVEAIPNDMKVTLTNRSGGAADYAMRVVALS